MYSSSEDLLVIIDFLNCTTLNFTVLSPCGDNRPNFTRKITKVIPKFTEKSATIGYVLLNRDDSNL